MPELIGTHYCQNGVLKSTDFFNPSFLQNKRIIYEVIRIEEGIGLFWEDHISRMFESLKLIGFETDLNTMELNSCFLKVIESNKRYSGNIKIMVCLNYEGQYDIFAYFIPHFYPSQTMYDNGIDTSLLHAKRQAPNIKALSPLREIAEKYIREKRIFEALLVNEQNNITEGSKSNIFFIQGILLVTPPADQVLKGITRQKIIDICNMLNYKVIEKIVCCSDLNKFDAAFITGTSPKVLPIRNIDEQAYAVQNQVINQISGMYDNMIRQYIRNAKLNS